jgi:Tfp pilus assembly protein PilO
MGSLSRRERTLIGLAVGGLVIVAAYLWVVEPLIVRNRQLAELAPTREATLEARRWLIAQRPRLIEELNQAARGFEGQAARLLSGPTPPLAASELQKLVKEVAAAANVDVRSERVLPAADLAGLQEVPIELTVAGTIREITNLLYEIEHTPRLLTIRDIKVRVVAVGQPRELLASLTVAGYLLPPQAGTAKN